jgi:hypothetical protein
VSNTEILELNTLNGTLNAALIPGVDEVRVTTSLSNGSGTAVVNGLTSNSTFVTNDSGDVRLNITNAQVAGTQDTLNLKTGIGGPGFVNVMAAGVETVAYTQNNAANAGAVTSVNFYDTDAVIDMTALTVKSNKGNTVNFDWLVNTIKTVDASAAEGNVRVSIIPGNPTNGVAITGGKGNDNLTGGDGKDVIVGGDGNDRISGDAYTFIPGTGGPAIPQVSTVTIANEEAGDQFTVTINTTSYPVTSTGPGTAAGLLATAIGNAGGVLSTPATAAGNVVTLTGPANGSAFTVTTATQNFAGTPATQEISTVTIPNSYVPDADDTISFDINGITFSGLMGQPVAAQVAAIVAAVTAAGQMTATSAVVGGNTVITLTGNTPGQNYTVNNPSLGANAATPAVAQVDTITLDDGAGGNNDLDPGDIIQVIINGHTVNYTITGTAATDANGLVNAINAAGLGVTAAFVDNGGAGLSANDGDQVTLTANTAGTPFTAAIQVNGAAPAEMTIATTTANVVATTTQNPATIVGILDNSPAAAVPAGINDQTATVATIPGQASADQYIPGAANADILTGGAGNDEFLLLSGSNGWNGTSFTTMDTITDLNLGGATAILGVDKIVLSSLVFNPFGPTDLINAGTPLAMTGPNLGAAVQALFNAGGALNGSLNDVGLFTYGADTYLIVTDNNAGFGPNDVIVKVTGVTGTLDLSDIVLL